MKLPINIPPLNVKLTYEELNEFISYIIKSYEELIINEETADNLTIIYRYHLIELINKTVQKRIKHYYEPYKKNITIKVNEVEQHLLSILFKRYECTPFMLQIQPRFINKLTKLSYGRQSA